MRNYTAFFCHPTTQQACDSGPWELLLLVFLLNLVEKNIPICKNNGYLCGI